MCFGSPVSPARGGAFHVVELASGVTLAEVIAKTGAAVIAKKGALVTDWFINTDTDYW